MKGPSALVETLGRQHGVVSRTQLLQLGMSSRSIERRKAAGEFVGVHSGVYRVAVAPMSEMQRLWAALAAAGDEAVVSHRAAAALWSLRGVSAQVPEISVIHERPRLAGCHVHRMQRLAPPDLVLREDGLPITSVARTLLDLGAVIHPNQVGRAAIDALHRRLVSWGQLAEVLVREGGRGRAGTAPLRRFMGREDPGVAALESELEVRFWELVRSYGLREPARQFVVRAGGRMFRIDFAYPDVLLAVEVDGAAWHGTAADRRRDRERTRALEALGWTVLRFKWEDVIRRPDLVVARINEALASRRAA